jgi:hypothetical protein
VEKGTPECFPRRPGSYDFTPGADRSFSSPPGPSPGKDLLRPDDHPGVTPGKSPVERIFLLSKQGISDCRFQIEDLNLKVAFVSLSLNLQSAF